MLLRLAFRFLRFSKGLSFLNIIAIAIGTSVPVAVEIANESVLSAFRETLDVVSGRANLEVAADGFRFSEQIVPRITLLDGVDAASPVVESIVRTPDFPGEYLHILGIDIFSYRHLSNLSFQSERESSDRSWIASPNGIAISEELATRLHLKKGDTIKVRFEGNVHSLTIRELIHHSEDQINVDEHVALMDIAAMQALVHSYGRIDRIDILTSVNPDDVEVQIAPFLPPGVIVKKPERRGVQIENMLNAFQLNLFALSLIAIIVAMFLFHSSLSTLIIRQRRSMGILRSIGFIPWQIERILFLQSMMITIVGVLLGTALGFIFARFSLGMMSQVVSSLYLLVHVQTLSWSIWLLLKIWILCLVFAFLTTWKPARESALLTPVESFKRPQSVLGLKIITYRWASVVFIFIGCLSVYLTFESSLKWLGFVSALSALLAIACWIPTWTRMVGHAFVMASRVLSRFRGKHRENRWSLPVEIGVKQLISALARPAIAASAVMTAFSMMLGTSILIDSFRKSVEYWIHQTIQADIYIAPIGNLQIKSHERIPAKVVDEIIRLPGVVDFDTHHELWMDFSEKDRAGNIRRIKLSSFRFDVLQRHHRFLFKGPEPDLLAPTGRNPVVLVNESFATHFRKRTGDVLALMTPSGKVQFEIAGIFYDYSTDSGQVVMDHSVYGLLWHDDGVYSLALYLEKGVKPEDLETQLKTRFGETQQLAIFSNQGLRSEVLRVFDQTFAITLGLRLIAVLVAATGMFFTLTTVIMERAREWAMLRSLGFTSRDFFLTAWTESLAIAVVGWLGSCVGGFAVAWLLAFVINRAYFGWTVQWHLNYWFFIQAFLLAVFAATLACVLSVTKQLKVPLNEALRYE